jgi:monoamine oxidase
MEERGKIPPSLPKEEPTVSYWQDPPNEIAGLRSTEILPQETDVVIVGSGISGATIAFNLLSEQPDKKIILLEARQAASGASGRNGRSQDNSLKI